MATKPEDEFPEDDTDPSVGPKLGIDRRAHERVVIDLEVDYCAADTFLFAYITDISAMGIFIRTNSPEVPGTSLTLRFTPPGGQTLRLQGEVAWINPFEPGKHCHPGMGVQFINLTDAERRQLIDLVKTFAYLNDPADNKCSQD